MKFWLVAAIVLAAFEAFAGDSKGGVTPGTRTVSGKISEWLMPTQKFARDPAIGPDGNVYYAVTSGDKIARFDPKSKRFQEWDLPARTRPRSILVTPGGKVLFGSSSYGIIGELDPSSSKVRIYKLPFANTDPYPLVFDAQGHIWFLQRVTGILTMLDYDTGKIREYQIGGHPYALSVDQRGVIWVTRKAADQLISFDPRTGEITELQFAKGSQPRKIAMAPDGMLWVSLYGTGKVAKIDPAAKRIVREYDMPGGPNSGPYAVNADADGRVWISEIQTDNVVMLDPRNQELRVFKLPAKDSGVRRSAIDAEGRYWYLGSNSGRLGVIE